MIDSKTQARVTLVFDGDCGFCTWSVIQLRRWVNPQCKVVPWQRIDLEALGLTAHECMTAIQFVIPGRRPIAGAAAVAAALATGRTPWPFVGRLISTPAIAGIAEDLYELIARNRYRLPGSTPACALPPAPR